MFGCNMYREEKRRSYSSRWQLLQLYFPKKPTLSSLFLFSEMIILGVLQITTKNSEQLVW
jgi:hypothetical protein